MRRKKSRIEFDGDIAYIELTKDQWAIIDVVDVSLIEHRPWFAIYNPSVSSYYAASGRRKHEQESSTGPIYLHRFLTGAPFDKVVDHKNHNTLDNRRSNLLVCDNWVNNQNRKSVDPRSTTGVRGVSIHTTPTGAKYYVAKVSVVRYFPHNDEGFLAAAEEVERLRGLLALDEA